MGALRMRWIEHALRAEAEVVVDGTLSVVAAHRVAEAAGRAMVGAVAARGHRAHRPRAAHLNGPDSASRSVARQDAAPAVR
ncbi:hypothetical protein [Kitasatospora indigofera]|uniref:hypothetical protein n=1 Tax=Kitasatospora indigofera TaxID=67307 RepID=UPI0036A4C9F8